MWLRSDFEDVAVERSTDGVAALEYSCIIDLLTVMLVLISSWTFAGNGEWRIVTRSLHDRYNTTRTSAARMACEWLVVTRIVVMRVIRASLFECPHTGERHFAENSMFPSLNDL